VATNKHRCITDIYSITPTKCSGLFIPDSHTGNKVYGIHDVRDIYLQQLGFHPVAMFGKHVPKQERDKPCTQGDTIHNTNNNTEYTK
jgi:hypothetical protein